MLLWLSYDYSQLSARAQAAVEESRSKNTGLAISGITLLEIARLSSHGRIRLTPDSQTFLSDVESRFVVLPISANVAVQAFALPARFPKDPVDRVIAATALIEDIPLLTADSEIKRAHLVPIIW